MNQILIKAQALRGPDPPVVKKEVHLARQEAEQILRDAHSEAVRIAAEAQRQRTSAMEAARQEGYAAGLAEWNTALVKAWKSYEDLLTQSETELIGLSVRIAEKIIGEELKTNRDAIACVVREAVRLARRARTLLIQVNPECELRVREKIDSFRSLLGETATVSVIADATVPPGGCVVETEVGIIDARLETQLKSLEQALLERAKQ